MPSPRRAFGYQVLYLGADGTWLNELNQLGAEGWHVVATLAGYGTYTDPWDLLLERETAAKIPSPSSTV